MTMSSSAPPNQFIEWCRQETPKPSSNLDLSKWSQAKKGKGDVDDFFTEIGSSLRSNKITSVRIDVSVPAQDYVISGEGAGFEHYLSQLQITNPISGTLTIDNVSVKHLLVRNKPSQLCIKHSNVGMLVVHPGCRANLMVSETNIGTLVINQDSISHLDMTGGCILNVDCPAPEEPNPFTGSVSLRGIFLPREPEKYLLEGPQPYRNLRSHLRKLENAQTANVVHSAELAVERKTDTKMNKLLSLLYEICSDFGSSALRPLVWLAVLFALLATIVGLADGVTLALPEETYNGWKYVLTQEGWEGRTYRAVVMAFQGITNPIGIFGSRGLLTPKYTWLAVLSGLQGLSSVVLIALFIFAVRRRFKIQ